MVTTWAVEALEVGRGVSREGNVSLTQLFWTESSSNEGRVEVLCQSHKFYIAHIKNTQSETNRKLFIAFPLVSY